MLDLKALGFTEEELKNRVVDQICEQLLTGKYFDMEDGEYTGASVFMRDLNKQIQARIDATIQALGEKHVLPNVTNYIETLLIQQTNEWGEKRGEEMTFIEYLVKRADVYMREPVDSCGKAKGEPGADYNWRAGESRITYLINSHLKYSIETAMKTAMKNANESIVGGIEATVKQKLSEVASAFKVSVSTGR